MTTARKPTTTAKPAKSPTAKPARKTTAGHSPARTPADAIANKRRISKSITAKRTARSKTSAPNMAGHPRLVPLVPDPAKYDKPYVHRKIGGVDDYTILDEAFAARQNVLITGPTGAAKTTFVYAWAAHHGFPVVNIACNGAIEPRAFAGGHVPTSDGGFAFVPANGYLAMMYGPAVVLADEINFMPPRIGAYVHPALDTRRIFECPEAEGSEWASSFHLHSGTIIIGTMNPAGGGYTDVFDLNDAFANRFAVQLEWGYDRRVEEQLVNNMQLLDFLWAMRKRVEDGTLRTPIPTNLAMEFEDFATNERLGFTFACEMLVNRFKPDEREVVTELLKDFGPKIAVGY